MICDLYNYEVWTTLWSIIGAFACCLVLVFVYSHLLHSIRYSGCNPDYQSPRVLVNQDTLGTLLFLCLIIGKRENRENILNINIIHDRLLRMSLSPHHLQMPSSFPRQPSCPELQMSISKMTATWPLWSRHPCLGPYMICCRRVDVDDSFPCVPVSVALSSFQNSIVDSWYHFAIVYPSWWLVACGDPEETSIICFSEVTLESANCQRAQQHGDVCKGAWATTDQLSGYGFAYDDRLSGITTTHEHEHEHEHETLVKRKRNLRARRNLTANLDVSCHSQRHA